MKKRKMNKETLGAFEIMLGSFIFLSSLLFTMPYTLVVIVISLICIGSGCRWVRKSYEEGEENDM